MWFAMWFCSSSWNCGTSASSEPSKALCEASSSDPALLARETCSPCTLQASWLVKSGAEAYESDQSRRGIALILLLSLSGMGGGDSQAEGVVEPLAKLLQQRELRQHTNLIQDPHEQTSR